MQCPSCRFENMPGVVACGRCGTSLRLASLAVDVHPPRARRWQKRLRKMAPVRRMSAEVQDTLSPAVTIIQGRLRVVIPPAPVLWRLAVPGWAQFYQGRKQAGWTFLGLYAGFLVLSLLTLGTGWSGFLWGAALSVHISSALDVLLQSPGGLPSRLLSAALVSIVLGCIVYGPLLWVQTHVASFATITRNMPPFASGDVVLVNRWAYGPSGPAVGDVVLYRMQAVNIPFRGVAHGNMRVEAGEGIDRILAGPGASVRWDNGRLYVNDQPCPWGPLNPARLAGTFKIQVPEGHYLILPSTANITMPHGQDVVMPELWQSLCVVPIGNVEGLAYLRAGPVTRLGFIR